MRKKSGDDLAVSSFVAAAEHFCDALERKARISKSQFLICVLKGTLALYGAGLELPDVEPESSFKPAGEWFEKNKRLPIEEQIRLNPRLLERSRQKQLVRRNIIHRLGNEMPYQMVFEPFQDHEQVTATVSDDLEDIYCDVKEGLLMIAGSEHVSVNVIWTWKFGLQSHWGKHAVNVICALHSALL